MTFMFMLLFTFSLFTQNTKPIVFLNLILLKPDTYAKRDGTKNS